MSGIEDPVEAMTEGVVYTLTQVHRTPHLGILLTSTNSSLHPEGLTSQEAQAFGMAMITRFDVDWLSYGYDETSLQELVEYVLRTMQSFFPRARRPEAERRGTAAIPTALDGFCDHRPGKFCQW